MKVILHEEIIGLGEEGIVVDVSAGYARNYLLPQKKAMTYNKKNISLLESQIATIEKRRAERLKYRMGLKEKLEEEPISIKMNVGENGKLFGSVTSQIIIDELEKKKISLLKRQITIPEGAIRKIGKYTIDIKLSQNVVAFLSLCVTDMNGNLEVKEDKSMKNEKKSKKDYQKNTSSLNKEEGFRETNKNSKKKEFLYSELTTTVTSIENVGKLKENDKDM